MILIDVLFTLAGYLLVGAVFVYLFAILFTKRGKEWLFGGEILTTLSPKIVTHYKLQTQKVAVHTVLSFQTPPQRMVGVEVSDTSLLSLRTIPITLTITEAKELIQLLEEAINQHEGQ